MWGGLQVAEVASRLERPQTAGRLTDGEHTMPVVPLPGMVLLPHMMAAIRVSDFRAIAAVRAAEAGQKLLLVTPGPEQDIDEDDEDFYVSAYDNEDKPVFIGHVGVVEIGRAHV